MEENTLKVGEVEQTVVETVVETPTEVATETVEVPEVLESSEVSSDDISSPEAVVEGQIEKVEVIHETADGVVIDDNE